MITDPMLACREMSATIYGKERTYPMDRLARLSYDAHRQTVSEAVNGKELN